MKIGVAGYRGRVGGLIVQELQSDAWPSATLSGCTSRTQVGTEDFFVTNNAEELFKQSDVIIDFTRPETTTHYAEIAASTGAALVIGTTGLSDSDEAALQKAAEKTCIVYAANMSVGVNLLLALVEQAASKLGIDYDIEISETHHKHKIDSPSGTALALGKAARAGRQNNGQKAKFADINRNGTRHAGDIGYAVMRGGDVVGEHTVSFLGEGERLELTHKASNRLLFAKGAIRAALWTKDQKPGLYSMLEVLGL